MLRAILNYFPVQATVGGCVHVITCWFFLGNFWQRLGFTRSSDPVATLQLLTIRAVVIVHQSRIRIVGTAIYAAPNNPPKKAFFCPFEVYRVTRAISEISEIISEIWGPPTLPSPLSPVQATQATQSDKGRKHLYLPVDPGTS